MSFLLASRPLGIGLGLGAAFTSYSLLIPRRNLYALCDSSATLNSYTNNAKVPVVNRRGGLNPNAVRQISSGSIAGKSTSLSFIRVKKRNTNNITGVLGGMAISLFSKPLTLLIGLLIVGVQVNLPSPPFFPSTYLNFTPTFAITDFIINTVCRITIGNQSYSLWSLATLFH